MVEIDGSFGEGGGQILRTSAALAVAAGKVLRVGNIRAGRPKPGLRPQHVTALTALAKVCGGELTGATVGSRAIKLRPGPVTAGDYHFEIGTAGSANLVLQTLGLPLVLAEGVSKVTVGGGTHNPWAPSFEYLRDVYAPLASIAGIEAFGTMSRVGFYPAGGGEVTMQVRGLGGASALIGLKLTDRGDLRRLEGLSAVSEGLPDPVADRQASQVLGRLRKRGLQVSLEQARVASDSPGTTVFIRATFSRCVAGFFALGRRGRPAEAVADEAVDALFGYLDAEGALDGHAADQLLTALALSPEPSRYTTTRVSRHLSTNAEVIRQITGREVGVAGELGQPGRVFLGGK